ncbi:MAG: hypothetical protein IT317_22570 [Anaerolineales bacterium]|nr:hypothetical protein [Anaerolineales bacterium]
MDIDVNVVIENTRAQVEKSLPGAYLTFLSIVAQCSELEAFQGEVNLDFTQVRQSLFGERITVARARVDTVQRALSLEIRDETEYYPSAEALVLQGLDMEAITSSLVTYLRSIEQCGGTVVLARTSPDSPWRVRCGPPDEVFIECLEIDPTTGAIKELR